MANSTTQKLNHFFVQPAYQLEPLELPVPAAASLGRPDAKEIPNGNRGNPFTINAIDYILVDQNTCCSAFTGTDINLPWGSLGVIGDVFHRRYFAAYDLGKNAVDFAKSA